MHIKKITLVSNNICYVPEPAPNDEIEQRLTIDSSGGVCFTGYNYSGGFGSHIATRKMQVNIGEKTAIELLSLFLQYFEGDYSMYSATDVGVLALGKSDFKQHKHKYHGSL